MFDAMLVLFLVAHRRFEDDDTPWLRYGSKFVSSTHLELGLSVVNLYSSAKAPRKAPDRGATNDNDCDEGPI